MGRDIFSPNIILPDAVIIRLADAGDLPAAREIAQRVPAKGPDNNRFL
jgi:hypothetical protein